MKRWSFLQRHKALLVSIGLFSLAFFIRAVGLDVFSTIDEGAWLGSSLRFLDALGRGDLKDTLGFLGHPGVTTEWIGSVAILLNHVPHIAFQQTGILVAGSPFKETFQPTMELLVIARYPIVLLSSLFVVAVYVVLRNTLNGKIALLSALLLIFDPFFVAMSRVFLTDALHAIFAVVSVMCLGLALGQNKWHWYVLSGASAGLAFLSKAPAIFVLLPLTLIVSTIVHFLKSTPLGNWKSLVVRLGVWCASWFFCVLIVWPSMWAQPFESLKFTVDTITEVTASGRWRTPDGPFFYLWAILFRSTPLVLVGSLVTLVPLVNFLRNMPKKTISYKEIWLLLFWMLVGAYTVMFSLGLWKNDFYILPACVAITILGAMGLIGSFDEVAKRLRLSKTRKRLLETSGIALISALQLVLCVSHYPYYFSYFNPIVGGGHVAEQLIPSAIAHGMGLDQVMRYLNAQDNSQSLYVGMNVIGISSCVELNEFAGHLIAFPDKWTGESDRHWSQLDYVVYYRNFGRYRPSRVFADLIDSASPDFTAEINGIEYAWVYKIPEDKLTTLPPEAHQTEVEYENCLELVGYEIHPMTQRRDGTQQLPVSLYWQASEYCRDDYQVVLKLRNDAHSVWGSKDIFPTCQGWENSWRNDLVMPDEHRLEVLPGTPPGSYTLEMIALRRPDGQEMIPDSNWDNVLGTVDLLPNPNLDVHSLDMEHEINANLADKVMLLGYSIAGGAQPGETLHLTLFWQVLVDRSESYKVFVHVVDDQGSLLNQIDSNPVDGFYPTNLWQKDEIVRDQYRISFSDKSGVTAAGLRIGMYDPLTGERLPVLLENGTTPEDRTVSIP